jgi:signal peptidase
MADDQDEQAKPSPPAAEAPASTTTVDDVPAPTDHPIRWYRTSENGLVIASRDILTSLLAVAVIGLVLFAISGVWPPLVAVESGSMEPNMQKGDLIFLVETDRYTPAVADEAGMVTARDGADSGHERFNRPGSVIVYRSDGRAGQTPIIHRVMFHVEAGENWYPKTKAEYTGTAGSCASLQYCRADHDGYVTLGDANPRYDQIGVPPRSEPVKEHWIRGKAVARIPWLGCVRLELSGGPSCLHE